MNWHRLLASAGFFALASCQRSSAGEWNLDGIPIDSLRPLGTIPLPTLEAPGNGIAWIGQDTIAIPDIKAGRLLLVAAAERQTVAFGRTGAGPDEFRAPIGLAWSDTIGLAVVDIAMRRLSLLASRSHPTRTYNLPLTPLGVVGTQGDTVLISGTVFAQPAPRTAILAITTADSLRLVRADTLPPYGTIGIGDRPPSDQLYGAVLSTTGVVFASPFRATLWRLAEGHPIFGDAAIAPRQYTADDLKDERERLVSVFKPAGKLSRQLSAAVDSQLARMAARPRPYLRPFQMAAIDTTIWALMNDSDAAPTSTFLVFARGRPPRRRQVNCHAMGLAWKKGRLAVLCQDAGTYSLKLFAT